MTDKVLMAKQMRKAIQAYVQDTVKDESKMMEFADIYPEWAELIAAKMEYPAGTVFKYGTNGDGETQLWSFISSYTPQEIYTPDVDISHYKKIGFAEGTSFQIWSQPYGQTDAYMKGDIVSYNGELWICEMDYCVWAPGTQAGGVTLWSKYTPDEEEPEEPDVGGEEEPTAPEYPEWVAPVGTVGLYSKNDIVSHGGKLWVSLVDNNSWEPGTVGTETVWQECIPPTNPN